jgi:hypothetical protein
MHKNLVRKPEEKRQLGRIYSKWEDNTEMWCIVPWREDLDWIHVVQVGDLRLLWERL